MLFVALGISWELSIGIVSHISRDVLEAGESFYWLTVDVHVFHPGDCQAQCLLSLSHLPLEHLGLLLVLLDADKDVVDQDVFVRGAWLVWLHCNCLSFICDGLRLNFQLRLWSDGSVFNGLSILSRLVWVASGGGVFLLSLRNLILVSWLLVRMFLILICQRLRWIMDELAPYSVRAVPILLKLLAQFGLVIGWNLRLNHHVGPAMSKGTSISILAFAIQLKGLAHLCSKFMNVRGRWSEVVVQF